MNVTLVEVPWSSWSSSPWFARAKTAGRDLNLQNVIEIRRGLRRLPYIGVRILRHELDHIRDESFRHPDPIHDAPGHICGRGTRWWNVTSSRHLTTTRAEARQLAATGKCRTAPAK